LDLVVCITEHIPVQDMVKVRAYMKGKKTKLIGPNCPGILTVDECRLGLLPTYIHKKGHVGVISRSGTLTYEATYQLTLAGIGQTTCVGLGGDPVKGLDFIEVLDAFNKDDDTYAMVMIGEIGGTAEEAASKWIKANTKKPVVAFIAGRQAPPGKRMGHAGAIISGGKGTAADKIKALNAAGIEVADTVADIGATMVKVLKKAGLYEKCHTC
jgi:succinyl-CoA synthetase alpha subunit